MQYNYHPQLSLDSVVGSFPQPYVLGTEYDVAGRMVSRMLGQNSLQTDYTYYPWTSQGGRLLQIYTQESRVYAVLQNLQYTYDEVGNVMGILDDRMDQEHDYDYDSLYRLIHAEVTGSEPGTYSEDYTYSTVTGNLASKGGASYTYGDANHAHAVTAVPSKGWSFVYDNNGNMTQRNLNGQVYNLGYDRENRMTSVSGAASANYGYDGDGNRIIATEGVTTTVYIGSHFEWTANNSKWVKYYYAGASRVAMRTGNGEGDLKWLLTDHLGSTSVAANSDGSEDGKRGYRAWGEPRFVTGDDVQTDYRYTGQKEDSYIKLYWYGSRWYDPALGRWTQPDTIVPQAAQGVQAWDRFAYVNNSPTGQVDPTGHWGYNFNLSNWVNSTINWVGNFVGITSTDVVNGLNTASTILDGVGLAIDTAIAAGDVVSGVNGALTGGFTSIPEAGAPSAVTVPAGAAIAIAAFELNPITRGGMVAGNVLATVSTLLTAASDVMTGETNITESLTVSDGGIGFSYTSSIGRDTLTSGVTCLLGWASPIGLISAPIAAIPFANDLGILYPEPLPIIPEAIPIINIDIGME